VSYKLNSRRTERRYLVVEDRGEGLKSRLLSTSWRNAVSETLRGVEGAMKPLV